MANTKNAAGGGGAQMGVSGTNISLKQNVTMPTMPAGAYSAEQQEYAQQQQIASEPQQAYMPQQSNIRQPVGYNPQQPELPGEIGGTPTSVPPEMRQPGGYNPQQPEQPGEIGGTPTPEPSARAPTILPGTGDQGRFTPTPVPAYQPGMPDMSEYFAGWQAAIEQLYRMLPCIFSGQFNFMPSWPAWPQFIKTI